MLHGLIEFMWLMDYVHDRVHVAKCSRWLLHEIVVSCHVFGVIFSKYPQHGMPGAKASTCSTYSFSIPGQSLGEMTLKCLKVYIPYGQSTWLTVPQR